jgi:hypothetical protein
MSRAKVLFSISMVLILIALSGASVWAAPEGQGEEPDDGEGFLHPVASALAEFFNDLLNLPEGTIMEYHEGGIGFGVIAQACWMSYALEGDATLLGDILEAKKSHDFSTIKLPDGETPTNWGQFRKAVLGSKKAEKNLGAIMSGRAKKENEQEQNRDRDQNQDQVEHKKGKGSDEEIGGPPAEPPGKSKDKGSKGSGPPAEPPGQDKGGGNDKGGGEGKGNK